MTLRLTGSSLRDAGILVGVWVLGSLLAHAQAVTTYHYDTFRTGWNSQEVTLTPANVPGSLVLKHDITLDDQVDAQPLFVPGVNITVGPYKGTHDVVYVATESNSIYAIDANTGTVLLTPKFGTPIFYPIGCGNNGPNVGINSTPAIDLTANTMYVITYSVVNGQAAYKVHALDLGSLTDKVPARIISASHTLIDGTTFNFNAAYQRQRPALLLTNGNLYAGFGSFCDLAANVSRGWLLGWAANTLTPLSANQMFNIQATSPDSFFLSSIWMSGYGLATDFSNNVLFVTGNSDYSGSTYDGVTNIQESVVKVSGDLTTLADLFTPSNQSLLDQTDADFGSGGVMMLPAQSGSYPHLAVAAGKVGSMFLMNEDSLGGYSPYKNNVLGTYSIGACWCGPSYFVDSDGIGRVVSSGGKNVNIWKLSTSPSPSLTNTNNAGPVGGGQTGGFFTTISSNFQSNPIIWSLAHPQGSGNTVYLFAFDPDTTGRPMTTLFRGKAGTWPFTGGNANLVPVVANGQVFVATYAELRIFGLR
jgi:hypothetical protein